MRKSAYGLLAMLLVTLVGCVTINVYFPEAAAQKAADQFIGSVLDKTAGAASSPSREPAASEAKPPGKPGPSASLLNLLIPAAYAGDAPNIRIETPATEAIKTRMKARFQGSMGSMFNNGSIGFTHGGLVAEPNPGGIALDQRAQVKSVVAAENADRNALYAEVAKANGHPEWESKIRATFAQGWIERAHSGWYYQNAAGAWKRK